MKSLKIALPVIVAFISTSVNGQLFRPFGLNIEKDEQQRNEFHPRMHIEENTLYVCTNQGLYSKDLSNDGSEWLLAGFEGIPLQDYARCGNDILALRHNVGEEFLLLSHDGGKTYEDVTPEPFKQHFYGSHVMISLVQHPDDPNTLLVSSYYLGIYQSTDFGKTWSQLTEVMVGKFIGYHPSRPEIIYNSGETYTWEPLLYTTYDKGETWRATVLNGGGDNRVCRISFNPTNPDCWISGGWNVIYNSVDNGYTWDSQFMDDNNYGAFWSYFAYDTDNSNNVYAAGGSGNSIKLMYSPNGGKTWSKPQSESSQNGVNDFLQCGDKLLIYANTEVYEVSKAKLIELTTPVTFTTGQMATIILPTEPDAGKGKYYRLDRVEDNKIVFEQELQPRAHVPYIIVPFEDFSIDPGTLDLAGLKPDTVSVGSISFIGTYVRTELPALTGGDGEWRPFPPSLGGDGGGFYRIIDTTPDCSPLPAEGQGERLAYVGALRAYLTWDDPYGPGATKGPEEEMKIVLHDKGTGSLSPAPSPEGEGRKDAAIYDLSGKKVNGKWLNGKSPKGIYIKDRKKWVKPFK